MNLSSELGVPSPELDAACRAFAVPHRISPIGSEAKFLEKGSQAFLNVDDERISFWTYGSGPVILLIHDWSSLGSRMMGFVKPLVALGFSVVLFDAPGHGQSTGICSSVIQAGKAALRLAEHLNGVHGVIAHSAGSLVALWALSNGLSVHRSVHIRGPSPIKAVVAEITNTFFLNARQATEFLAWVETFMGVTLDSINPQALSFGLKHPGLIIYDSDDSSVARAQAHALYVAWIRSTLIETKGLGQKRILSDSYVIRSAVEFIAVTFQTPKRLWSGTRNHHLRAAAQIR